MAFPTATNPTIKAAVGAGFEFGKQLYQNGGDFSSLDLGAIGMAALGGAVSGAISAIPFTVKNLKKIILFFVKLLQDLDNFDFKNTSEQVVIDANYFSFYKGAPVIKHHLKNDNMTSCTIFGIIFINGDSSKLDRGVGTIKHEWGHFVQEKYYGEVLYLLYIAYPSLTHRDSEKYYSQPWEYGADVFGGVQDYSNYTSDAPSNFIEYHNKIMRIRRRRLRWLRKFFWL